MAGAGSPPRARSTCSATAAGASTASSPPDGTGSWRRAPASSTSSVGSSTHQMSSACAAASRSMWSCARSTKAGDELLVVVHLERLGVPALAPPADAGRRVRGGVGDQPVPLALEMALADEPVDGRLDVLACSADGRGDVVEAHRA